MSPQLVIFILVGYFLTLIVISMITSKGASSDTFFTANRQSPWYLVAFGMIGASLSGVTFISVPGNVGEIGFGYFQVVLGYLVGYWVIIGILLPLYYKLNLISIYTYLEQRFDWWSYKTGAFFFMVSRSIGSALRLYLAATVLQLFLFDAWGIPFYLTVAITIVLIWVYTFRGGIKTIVYTDTFQTFFLIAAACIAVWQIAQQLDLDFGEMLSAIRESGNARVFYFDDPASSMFFPKQFLGGAFITITMTGMDQEIMQKNLTCRNLKDAQKNMFWFSLTLVLVNLLFLMLGALLYLYSAAYHIPVPAASDELFPALALNHLGLVAGVFFLLGITASSYASADSALAGLTTSFCIDFLNFKDKEESVKRKQKFIVHVCFSLLFFLIIAVFREINEKSVIDAVLIVAGYTYGPLLGLFAFGLLTRRSVRDPWVPAVTALAVILSLVINPPYPEKLCSAFPGIFCNFIRWREQLLDGYQIGLELLLFNGFFTYAGLYLISRKERRLPSR